MMAMYRPVADLTGSGLGRAEQQRVKLVLNMARHEIAIDQSLELGVDQAMAFDATLEKPKPSSIADGVVILHTQRGDRIDRCIRIADRPDDRAISQCSDAGGRDRSELIGRPPDDAR